MRLPYESGKVELTSKFGWRTLNGVANNHKGIDLVGRTTKTVVAPCDGVIGQSAIFDKATDKTGTWEWGNYVRIDTPDGLKLYFCHLAERKVKAGDRVKAGDVIGIEGNTGYSFGSHLHFEVRKNGVSVNPCTYLGIPNAWGIHEVKPAVVYYPDTYSHDGLTFTRCKNFAVLYWEQAKDRFPHSRYTTGGFWAPYRSATGAYFTLPVANLVCDCSWSNVPAAAQKYLSNRYSGGKLRIGCNQNQSDDFKGKSAATLVVPKTGSPYIDDMTAPPADCLYAISGVPTVMNGDDVDFENYVLPQGWKRDTAKAAYHIWYAVRNGEIWLVDGQTYKNSFIYGMEIWKKVRDEGFDGMIAMDSGGSAIKKNGSSKKPVVDKDPHRIINNVVRYG